MPRQRGLAHLTRPEQHDSGGMGQCLAKGGFSLAIITCQTPAHRPQPGTQGPQRAMRLQAHGATDAIEKGMHPGAAMVRGGDAGQHVVHSERARISHVQTVEKGRQGRPERRFVFVTTDGYLLGAQRAWHDDSPLESGPVFDSQPAIQRGMGLPQEGGAQGSITGDHPLFKFSFGLDMCQCQALQSGDIGLLGKVTAQRPFDIDRMCALPLDAVRIREIIITDIPVITFSYRMNGGDAHEDNDIVTQWRVR